MKRFLWLFAFLLLLAGHVEAQNSAPRGTCSASTTSCTLSSVAAGDLKVIFAARSGSTTAPTLPSGFTSIGTGSAGSGSSAISYRVYCSVASSSSDTGTGTATNASVITALSYGGTGATTTAACATSGNATGGKAGGTGTSTTQTIPAITMVNTTSSWVAAFAGARTTTTCLPASGLTNRANIGSGPSVRAMDTNGIVSSWTAKTCTITSTSSVGYSLEIMAAQLAAPVISPTSQNFSGTQSVSISGPSGATICYTTNGATPAATTPGTCSTGTTYSGAFNVSATTTVKAIATQAGLRNSTADTETFTLVLPTLTAPSFSPTGGSFGSAQTVTITYPGGSTVCYTTDGTTTPAATTAGTCSTGSTYSAPLSFSSTTTLKAIATQSGYQNSSVTSDTYTITVPHILWNLGSIGTFNGITIGTSAGNIGTWNNILFGGAAIALDASCSGTSANTTPVSCSSPMTVTAGDAITCQASTSGWDPLSIFFSDPVNGTYDNVLASDFAGVVNTWVAESVFTNSAGGSITPAAYTYEGSYSQIQCQAWKGVATSAALDGGLVLQFKSQASAAANPTSGTAATPTNDNELVIGHLVQPAPQTTSAGSGWTPSGTLTGVTASDSQTQYFEYQIQTTKTAVSAPFTSASSTYTDAQYALLKAGSSGGYRSFTGFFGVPAIAKSNGATATAADLSGATTTLSSLNPSTGWVLTGSAATYDTSVAPTGTKKIIVDGVPHTFGDAGTSLHFAQAATAVNYALATREFNGGQAAWLSTFLRVSSAGTSSNGYCDIMRVDGSSTDPSMWVQAQYDTTNGLRLMLEPYESGGSLRVEGLSLDTDYWVQEHVAGVNERYHQLLVYSKSGPTWSLAGTLNYDLLCTTGGNADCSTSPATSASTTGTASSGSTTLTVASGTGIAQGQIVTGTNIPWLTMVASVSGTTVTLSQKTTGALSGTAVKFYPPMTNFATATNGSAGSGSTALTVVVPSYGTISVGQSVGGAGIAQGTIVTAVAGTSVTLSQPTTSALSSTGVWFFSNGSNVMGAVIGKWSSCISIGSVWTSATMFDPVGNWGAFAPN